MSDRVYDLVETGTFHLKFALVPMEEAVNVFYTGKELDAKYDADKLEWTGKSNATSAPEYVELHANGDTHFIMMVKLVQHVLAQLADPKKKSVVVDVPVPHLVSFGYNKMFREQYAIQFSPSKMEFTRAPKPKAKPLVAGKGLIMTIQREMISSLETIIRKKYGLVNVKIAATSSKNQLNNGVLLAKDLGHTVDNVIGTWVVTGTERLPGVSYDTDVYTWTIFTLADYLASPHLKVEHKPSPEMQVLLHKAVTEWWDSCTEVLK